ncbi:monovalent cation/H(+) antiporter subunit G [Metabacillus sediminilitoris]|jgi:multicomponent Na+:H+ antiporter subunit G|uniref:Na+/H+ antiporter subunit G n=1 Tax=Metabacillus sediminilitoris TaxID=2567941 RepID=A0A4S4C0C3_9BACI|nr:monovalent cation/H(+) antiporter subunit G [Metabacillus sediminilitoris]QGQ47838.1 Na+/H+ antiporter subunit G [Metabacillus sediminilitoris]THF81049.1 Na+/H+ antiporter subunit G [Metabacillus sediminilitoris]
MIEISKFVVGLLILLGSLLSLLAAIGVVRLPDAYTRNHAASKSATLGVLSILLGLFLYYLLIDHVANARVLLGIVFVFITSPIAGHLIMRAAYNIGVPLWENSVQDDLQKARKRKKVDEQ